MVRYAVPTAGRKEAAVAAKRPTRTKAGKGTSKRTTVRSPEGTAPIEPEQRFVDIDPWAVMLEQLMEVPEDKQTERRRTKAK